MKKATFGIVTVLFLFSCGNKEKKVPAGTFVEITDTVVFPEDTVSVEEPFMEELPTVRANESFDDFVFNFISNERLQLNRIIFPLSYYKNDTVLKIEKSDWITDNIFYDQVYYTLLFDEEDDLDIIEDTSNVSVQVEEIFMESLIIRKHYFERVNGRWMLEAINEREMEENMNRDFVEFFYRFSNDSIFQSTHTRNPLKFITADPDDDFAVLETTLDYNQWLAFKPVLPKEQLSNISYGQSNNPKSSHKILQIKGIENGFLNTLFFRRKNDTWELNKFEDTSN